jgi:L-alanine-DL-glutamate epimerase-like enolase superfamily enzyme
VTWSRRDLLKAAMAIPAGSWLSTYRAWAASAEKMVKITAIKALQLDNVGDGCLIRVETDAGVVGYGEAGCTSKMARARIEQMQRIWMGEDPLAIENLFYKMTAPQNAFIPAVGVVSGIDIALWDIAGKVIGQPIYRLMGGPIRPAAPLYSHGNLRNMLDPVEAKDWAQKVKAAPEGFRTFKFGFSVGERGQGPNVPGGPWSPTADHYDLKKVAQGFANIRNSAGDDLDIAMHGLGQFDLPTAIGLARAIEPIEPAWFEDPLNYVYSESWEHLKRATRTPILTGEKVEMVAGFKPYLDNGAVDVVHPDPAYAGGITGIRKIADYAAVTRVPIACHSGPCSLVRFYASLHLAGAIQNFFRVENVLGEFRGFKEKMALHGTEPVVRNSQVALPAGHGLGLQLNEDWLKEHTAKGEPSWT